MNPILYESRETDFNHNGLGKMNETLSAIVTEVANGEFELEVVYPIGGRLYKHIQDHMLIKAKPNSVDDPHVFRIYEHTIDTVGQTVTVYAHTKSNDLGQNLVKDVVISSLTPQEAMNNMKMNLVEPTDYSFVSDITTRSSTEWKNRNPLNCIAGEEGSLIHYWGGEIKRDNRTIYLYRRRGRDNVAIIRDGKNINGLSLEYSTKGMVTKIIPYRTYTPEDSEDEVVEYGTPVESQYIGNYPLVYVRAIDYSNDENVTSLETMNTKATRYFTENNGVDKPSVNVRMGLVELSDSSEYEKFKDFENVELFDTVTVYSKQYDINIETKITTVVYDSLTGKNISLEMGSYRTGLIESTERTYMELIGEKEAKLTQTIQVAANGKNRVFRGVTEPTTGMVKNDIWYQPVGAGETMMYVFDGAYWQLNKVSAGLLGGTLDAENGDVNLINVNVANIVGEISEFIKSYWNNIAGGQITIDGNRFEGSDPDGNRSLINTSGQFRSESGTDGRYGIFDKGRIWFYNEDSSAVLNIGAHPVTGDAGFLKGVLATARAQRLILGRYNDYLTNNINATVNPYISFEYGATVGDEGNVYIKNWKDVSMSGKHINDVQLIEGYGLALRSSQGRLILGAPQPDGKRYNTLEVGFANTKSNGNIDMGGYTITNQSDIRLKTNVVDSEVNALHEIERMKFIEYDWDLDNPANDKKPTGRQFGIVAQYSPFLQTKASGSESYLSVDMSKQVNLNSKAIQELKKENDTLKQEITDLKKLLIEKGLI